MQASMDAGKMSKCIAQGSVMASAGAADAIKIPRTQAYSEHLAREFQQLRVDGELTDFTIHTSTRSYRCHQFILAGVSQVLRAMLSSRMVESSKQEVTLEHISSDVMEIILTYMYTGEVNIPEEKLLETIEASDYLQLLELKELSLHNAVLVCKPSNVLGMYKLAEQLNVDVLKSKCTDIISSSLAKISKFEEFRRLQSTELSSLLSAAQKSNVDPDELLEATLDWIDYKPDQRITAMEKLIQDIDIVECSLECLETVMTRRKALLMQCPEVLFIFTNGVVQIAKQGCFSRAYRFKRDVNAKIIVLGGQQYSQSSTPNRLCWELKEAAFSELCHIPQHSLRFAVCKTPSGFALTGGEDCTMCSLFDMTTKLWRSLQSLRHPRHAHKAICFDGMIMVFGGVLQGLTTSSVQSLKIDGGEWTDEPDIPKAVPNPEVASVKSGIFFLNIYDDKLFHLDVATKKWSKRAPVPLRSFGARMVCVDDQLLVAGGRDRKIFAHYNISSDVWTLLTPPLVGHLFGAMFYANRTLYLMGGQNEDRVEEYNMVTKSWSVNDIKVPRKLLNLNALVINI